MPKNLCLALTIVCLGVFSSYQATAQDFWRQGTVCIGERHNKCPFQHQVFGNCGDSLTARAAQLCTYETDVPKSTLTGRAYETIVTDFTIGRRYEQTARGGRCGYTTYRVTCCNVGREGLQVEKCSSD